MPIIRLNIQSKLDIETRMIPEIQSHGSIFLNWLRDTRICKRISMGALFDEHTIC